MDNRFVEEQMKLLTFKEEESKKVSAIRKVISSLAFKIMMCVFLCAIATSIAAIVVNNVTMDDFSNNMIGTLIFDCLIEMLLPLLFLRLLYLSYKVSKGKKDLKYNNSLLGRLFSVRRYAKFVLIIMSISCIIEGLYTMNLENVYYSNKEAFDQMAISYSAEELHVFSTLGRNTLFQGIVFAFLAYGCLKAFKAFYRNIFLDEKDNKLIELLILMGLLIAYGLLLILGNVLALAGVETFLTSGLLNPKNVGSWLSFVSFIAISVTLFLGAYVLFQIRKALIENNGSSNPLAQDVVYTISEKDITDVEDK